MGHSDYLECIDKFVVLYDWNNVSGIMCPSFNISKINSTTFQCPINLTHLCNETINIEFETWTLDKKFLKNGPFGRVFLNCSLLEIPENSQKGLSEAIFSILEGAASILSEVPIVIKNWTSFRRVF